MLIVLGVVAALLIALPAGRRAAGEARFDQEAGLLAERRQLLAELHEVDEDAAAGRISADDRMAARRSLGPRLRAVTEALRSYGADEDRT